jgi:hypothetical protein
MSGSKPLRDATASKRRLAVPARKRKVTAEGPLGRASAATVEFLHRLGLGWVFDALTTSMAAGLVVGEYSAGTARSQLILYSHALRAVIAAERDIAGSLAKGELLEVFDRLFDAVAFRIAQLNGLLGLATTADFDDIADRIAGIDRRVARIEKVRSAKKPKDEVIRKQRARKVSTAPALPRVDLDLPVDERPLVETATTMFIGSLPEGGAVEPRPVRASSVSSEPDAMSAYLAKNPGDPEATDFRSRRRGGRRGVDS